MKFRFSATLVVFAAALWTLQSAHVRTQAGNSTADVEQYQGHPAVAHEVLVRIRTGAGLGPLHLLVDAVEDQPVGSQGWHRIKSSSRLVEELLARVAGRVEVLDAEPNYIVHTTTVPNDPLFPNLWGMFNSAMPGADIHATAAWDVITGSTANVVGVVDTGVDYTHPDLAANMWAAPTAFTVKLAGGSGATISCPAGSHGYNAITGSCDPQDDNLHGTHVSGTIGAVGNNATGVVGVNWTTRIMGLKFLDSTGSGSVAAAVDAIDFAVQTKSYFAASGGANVRVLSNSWGGSGLSSALSQEITAAGNANMLFVAAAGNAASDNDSVPFYPASYTNSNLIAVAATTESDGLASFSNYGVASVDLGAPGTDILSTEPGGAYGGLSGTSMATPHVSGTAMLVLAACNLTTTQLKNAILNNVDALASLSGLVLTGGRLNANNAVRSCATLPTVSLTSPVNGAVFVAPASISLAANASSPNGISHVDFYQGSTVIATSSTAPYGATWNNVAAGVYTLTAKAYDSHGVSAVSSQVTVTVNNGGGGGGGGTSSETLLTTQVPASTFGGGAYELGMQVMSDVAGQITAVRFWKSAGETGSHTGRVWSATGQLLTSVAFTNESASGWQVQSLGTPLAINANTTYVVSVNTNALWSGTANFFATPLTNSDLTAPGGTNGVYGNAGAFPTAVSGYYNYFRDVVFVPGTGGGDTTPPTVAITTPAANSTVSGTVTLGATATDNVGVVGVQFQIDQVNVGAEQTGAGPSYSVSWDTTTASNTTHTVTAIARDAAGNRSSASLSVTVNNGGGGGTSSETLLTTQVPASTFGGGAYELGMQVISDVAGQITAVRFWKSAGETGSHTGRIWSATGQLLSSVAFTNESASGWQVQSLGTPLAISANTTYVVSVNSNALWSGTANFFATPLTNGDLTAPGGTNGVYANAGAFPTAVSGHYNYFRDVVFSH